MTQTLSRLNIVDTLDDFTPTVVLQEIALCHQIPQVIVQHYSPIVFMEEVRNKPIGNVRTQPEADEYEILAQYINPTVSWSGPELLAAFTTLENWTRVSEPTPPREFTYGLQTPTDPHRLNACILYKICKCYSIPVHYNQTLYQMAHAVYMLSRKEDYVLSILFNTMLNISHQNLIGLYTSAVRMVASPNEPTDIEPISNYQALEHSFEIFNSKGALQLRVTPKSYAEAIVMAAINYDIDLSLAGNPVSEYVLLTHDPTNYIPRDENLQAIHNQNPILLRLTETFNPLLPVSLYKDAALTAMAVAEGYREADLRHDSAYTLLQTAHISDTFYHGRQLGIQNVKTPINMESVDGLANDIIICYGSRELQTMTVFRYSELAEVFKYFKNFNNPLVTNERFSEQSIRKLKNLARMVRSGQPKEVTAEQRLLYDALIVTELFTQETLGKARELYEKYTAAETPQQQKIVQAIWALFHLAMYMRGWLGEGEYPITRAPVDNQVAVDLKVTEGVALFEALCEELGEIGTVILDLPLLKYNSGEFQAITEERHGRTIRERITIVKSGDEHPNYDSCIRLSSNFFSASSYRYMEILCITPPFDVDHLRNIS